MFDELDKIVEDFYKKADEFIKKQKEQEKKLEKFWEV